MQENGWNQADVAVAAGIDRARVSRWSRATGKPHDKEVATIAARLGYDPRDFGITSPVALATATAMTPSAAGTEAPAWASAQYAALIARFDNLEKLLRDECEHVRILETNITNHLRKA
jgi:transcriptional regulator with XRE-family HTH domain